MGVEVATPLSFAVDQQVIAVEDRVIAGTHHAAAANGDEGCAAVRNYVETLVGAATAAGGAELTYVAARPVRSLGREDVVVEGEAAVG